MAGGPKLAVTLSVFNRKAAPHVPFEAEPLVENTPMSNVVIAGYARSPFAQANKGELVRVRPDELAAQTIKGLLERTKIDPDAIEDLILGCAFPEGEQGLNLGRIVGCRTAAHRRRRDRQSLLRLIHAPRMAPARRHGRGRGFICAGVESNPRADWASIP